MSVKTRMSWIGITVLCFTLNAIFSLSIWTVFLSIIPAIFSLYILACYPGEFRINIPWGIAHWLLWYTSCNNLSKSLDKFGGYLHLSETFTWILKIAFFLLYAFVIIQSRKRESSPINN